MSITITAVPLVVETPGFVGESVRIPLSAEPSAEWLDELRRQELPGKAHRVDGAAIEFYLDRDTRDVVAAMRRIAKAIEAADRAFDEKASTDGAIPASTDTEARRERINRLLQQWWEQENERRERQRAREPASQIAPAVEAATVTPAPTDASGDTSPPAPETGAGQPQEGESTAEASAAEEAASEIDGEPGVG